MVSIFSRSVYLMPFDLLFPFTLLVTFYFTLPNDITAGAGIYILGRALKTLTPEGKITKGGSILGHHLRKFC